jgi:Cu-Zn family superoxide dismutase
MKTILGISAVALVLAACAANPWKTAAPIATATATVQPASGSQVRGNVNFTQIGPNRVRVTGSISGHSAGPKGFHIHEKGDCSAPDAMSAGGHFNPLQRTHGATPTAGHAGDMGNIAFSSDGSSTINMVLEGISVSSIASNGIIGRAVVVHMQADDLRTDPTGNAGERAACGVIR